MVLTDKACLEEKELADTVMLYVHVPFCIQKCRYCDFLSFPGCDNTTKEAYTEALVREIRFYGKQTSKPISSVFFGGGTPTTLSVTQIQTILSAIFESFALIPQAEITIEMNPGTVTLPKAAALKEAGINRVSMGVQSFDDHLLRILGRVHSAKEAKESFSVLRSAGFDNISLDLMSGLPEQLPETWQDTLKQAVELAPEHLSCYSLIIEEGTPFYEQRETLSLPSEEAERRMYHFTNHYLEENGYERYEISNYSRKGKESRHNCGYWLRRDYIGCGLGASSLIDNVRFSNTEDMTSYIKETPDQHVIRKETLSISEQMEEFMFLGLRMKKGISLSDFRRCFGKTLSEAYGENYERAVIKPLNEGLLNLKDDRLFLTERGVDLSNQVFVEFLF